MRHFPHGSNAFPEMSERNTENIIVGVGIVLVILFLILFGIYTKDRRDPHMSGAAIQEVQR